MSMAYEEQKVAIPEGLTNVSSVSIYLDRSQELSQKGQWCVVLLVSGASSTGFFVGQLRSSRIDLSGIALSDLAQGWPLTLLCPGETGQTGGMHLRSPMVITPEVGQRLRGREKLLQTVYAIAHEEAQKQGIHLRKVTVRPAWSNEYDERTGVVVDVEIEGAADDRFSYWESVCTRLQDLESALPPQERDFLVNDLSFIVNRS